MPILLVFYVFYPLGIFYGGAGTPLGLLDAARTA